MNATETGSKESADRGNLEQRHEVDVCVIGGGMAGLCAALAAARHGARVALMHDRPVLGGNASSEVRVHVCGADRQNQFPNLRETGILEELRLENLYRNPNRSFSIWDTVLYEKARYQPNLALLLNCSCTDASAEGGRVASVTGWQATTYTRHTVCAKVFIDASGDGVLAPLVGAQYRMGREGRDEYGESIAPEQADRRTMGMTCLFQTRRHDSPQTYSPPPWAYRFDRCEDLPCGPRAHLWWEMGYWWVELGGEHHSIHDTEDLRDELLRIAFGVWDHVKNRCQPAAEKGVQYWALDWVQFLPGKRESRRYVGRHVLTQHDIESEGRFDDIVAYGGWAMDDHHPAGFRAVQLGAPATIFHKTPSPYGIPYGCIVSANVDNLMFAGRCASTTHAAMSSTRIMATGCCLGQAAGTAAAMAVRRGVLPHTLANDIDTLQQTLLRDDCYLPGVPRRLSGLCRNADLVASQGDPQPLRDGINRPVGDDPHCWTCAVGDTVEYRFDRPQTIREVSLVLDSALDRLIQMSYHHPVEQLTAPPAELPRVFRLETSTNGRWETFCRIEENRQRLVRVGLDREVGGVRFVPERTWGAERTRVFAFCLD